MSRVFFRSVLMLLGMVLLAGLSGCVTSKRYRLAGEKAPPPVLLDWAATSPNASLQVQQVIVYKGPGSWKQEARWDEYVVRVENRGTRPLVVEQVLLVDLLGAMRTPGVDPWALEKQSETGIEAYKKAGVIVLVGAGIVVYGVALSAVAVSALWGGASTGAVTAMAYVPVVAVANVAVVAVMNHQNKRAVSEEFARRRVEVPCTLQPGESCAGSFFFPITPAPRELVAVLEVDGKRELVELPLPQLSKLHLKPK